MNKSFILHFIGALLLVGSLSAQVQSPPEGHLEKCKVTKKPVTFKKSLRVDKLLDAAKKLGAILDKVPSKPFTWEPGKPTGPENSWGLDIIVTKKWECCYEYGDPTELVTKKVKGTIDLGKFKAKGRIPLIPGVFLIPSGSIGIKISAEGEKTHTCIEEGVLCVNFEGGVHGDLKASLALVDDGFVSISASIKSKGTVKIKWCEAGGWGDADVTAETKITAQFETFFGNAEFYSETFNKD